MIKKDFALSMILSGLLLTGLCGLSGCGRDSASDEGRDVTAGSEQSLDNAAVETEISSEDFYVNKSGVAVHRGSQLTIGFTQIGAESDWRLASSSSMEQTFSIDNGYNLIFDNAQQKQENQIKAIREFIDQGVDYIILDPIVETGWMSSLREAREAGIPVIIVDREVKLEDEDLYTAWIGSDFRLEGDRACAWLKEYLAGQDYQDPVGILHVQGTMGSSAQIGRSRALLDAATENGWDILDSVSGDFVQAKGKEVAEAALKSYGDKINVIYCENDNMAYGVIEALQADGKNPGTDIKNGDILIISFDSARDGLEYTLEGLIAVDTECNPMYGPPLSRLIMDLECGESVEKKNYYAESQFSAYEAISEVTVGDKAYEITMLDQKLIKDRDY